MKRVSEHSTAFTLRYATLFSTRLLTFPGQQPLERKRGREPTTHSGVPLKWMNPRPRRMEGCRGSQPPKHVTRTRAWRLASACNGRIWRCRAAASATVNVTAMYLTPDSWSHWTDVRWTPSISEFCLMPSSRAQHPPQQTVPRNSARFLSVLRHRTPFVRPGFRLADLRLARRPLGAAGTASAAEAATTMPTTLLEHRQRR